MSLACEAMNFLRTVSLPCSLITPSKNEQLSVNKLTAFQKVPNLTWQPHVQFLWSLLLVCVNSTRRSASEVSHLRVVHSVTQQNASGTRRGGEPEWRHPTPGDRRHVYRQEKAKSRRTHEAPPRHHHISVHQPTWFSKNKSLLVQT